ncbi:Amino acid/polyamine transporter I [Metarhizium album ARSEF 1941]|uniref:Amino acid/polyamine transporter I n=1 Tax=Metarhizium album (strain ARSEF 1941) TaxID=1081103 RepID=A0A0B2WEP1_METAS|nr:Amino acid/polyamine transporter I [Metarhizium album ARSEF 1941]KHN94306.1 Amino acid/polyamine transporter I [Metarhizium album ARSEF 1941]
MRPNVRDAEGREGDLAMDAAAPAAAHDDASVQNVKVHGAFEEVRHAKRGLRQRHMQMIALAGTIGTGLFLATGKALANGGPLGLVLSYGIVGSLVCAVVLSVGRAKRPSFLFRGAFTYANAILLPSEMVACAVIMDYWTHVNHGLCISLLGGLLVLSNMLAFGVYGEFEFVFSMLNIALILGVNVMSICITAGAGPHGESMGFRFWRHPGPFVQYAGIPGSWGQFVGFWRVLVGGAAYAFSNVENISVAGAETQSPRHNIPRAAKRVFWRVMVFYMLTDFVSDSSSSPPTLP